MIGLYQLRLNVVFWILVALYFLYLMSLLILKGYLWVNDSDKKLSDCKCFISYYFDDIDSVESTFLLFIGIPITIWVASVIWFILPPALMVACALFGIRKLIRFKKKIRTLLSSKSDYGHSHPEEYKPITILEDKEPDWIKKLFGKNM